MEYRKKLMAASIVALIAALATVTAVLFFPLNGPGVTLHSTQQQNSNFSVQGLIPYLMASAQNNSFNLSLTANSSNQTLMLGYDQNASYLVQYSNDTKWVNAAGSCATSSSGTQSGTNTTTLTTQPCGAVSTTWVPVGGSVVAPHLALTPNQIQVAVQPENIPPNAATTLNVKVSISLPRGTYALEIAIDVQTGNSLPVPYYLGYWPLVVK